MILDVRAEPITLDVFERFAELESRGLIRMRPEQELFGVSLTQSLQSCLSGSAESSVVFVNGEAAVLWGHGPMNRLAGVGGAWMIVLPEALKYKRKFAKSSKAAVSYLMTIYNRVEVVVDARFLQSIHWLSWLGFDKHPTAIDMGGTPAIFMWKGR